MPRNPGARKYQHNNRHENGLVGPGKRVTKQKSNGHLNGNPKASVPSQSSLPQGLQSQLVNGSRPEAQPSTSAESSADCPAGSVVPPALETQASESSYEANTAEENAKRLEAANRSIMTAQRRSDTHLAKPKASPDISALHIATTILKSRPAADTAALLIVLLSLPSMLLTIVQILFAALTLMPGAGFSPFSSLWSLFDLFHGSPGVPSISVMAWVDIILFFAWLILWNWAQHFALDLAQIHIAITLGNGSQGKSNSANGFCFIIVLLLHTIRSRAVRHFAMQHFIPTSFLSATQLGQYVQYLPKDIEFGDTPGPPSRLKSLFAIHIIGQALITLVRKYVASTQATVNTKSRKRSTVDLSTAGAIEPSASEAGGPAASSGVDFPPPPTSSLRDGKEKGISAKKRRRQANHVKSRQPFWAALASTKVHVLREVEHNKGLPNVPSNQDGSVDNSQDQVWVTNVGPSSIHFEAAFTKPEPGDPESMLPAGSKPFYVTINGARWHSVSIEPNRKPCSGEPPSQWIGEISGLAPDCPYTCSFICTDDDSEFAMVTVKAPALEDRDAPAVMAPIPSRQSTRPSSPTTTLKNSISAASDKLNEARKRLAQQKKQHKMAHNKVDRELDSLNGRLKSGGDDNKLRQKLLQTERNMRQTEDSTNTIKEALETLETVPEDEAIEHTSRKKAYEEQRALLAQANEALSKAKLEADNDMSCVTNELSTITSRKDRLIGRHAKLGEQYDRITQANIQGLNERERREAESNARESEYRRREADLQTAIASLRVDIRRASSEATDLWQRIELLEKQLFPEGQKVTHASGPLTPEGELPGTRPQVQSGRPLAFGSFNAVPTTLGPDPQASPFLAYANTLTDGARRPRSDTNRSLGALSSYSDFDDADPIPPMPSSIEFDVDGRKGSGSSQGKNNGSPAAGVIGGGLMSPTRGSNSPGHMPGSVTW
ncbi:hypothetical protein DV736_g5740, partial [Chaetothyriales sp. CBS 134916]